MGQPRKRWGAVEKYLLDNGYEIRNAGGEKVIVPPAGPGGERRKSVRVGHTSSNSPRAEILKCYESKPRNVFGIDLDDIE
jgi:hypothetical protein